MKKYLFFFAFIFALASMNAQVVWSDNFDDQDISDWSLYDEDGDGFEWSAVQLTDEFGVPVGTPILTSVSWSGTPLTPDNWAVSPAIDLTGASGDITLTWYVFASDPLYNLENYGVYVGTSNNVADLTAAGELFTEFELPEALTERTLDLSSFAGETIYVAFRHYDVSDQFRIGIDDVSVEIEGSTGGSECDQSFDGAFSLANSISGDLGYTVANDFVVAANNSMEIETLRLLLLPFAGSDADFDSFDVTLYSDNALTPGTPVTEATWLGLTGTSELHTETFAGYNTYWVTLEIPDYTIPANSADTHYWISVTAYSISAQNIFWVGYDYVEGSPTASNYQSEDGGVTWTQITYDGVGDHYDSIWEMDATCELGVSDMNSFDFTYYPNPVKDYLTIDSKQQVASYSAHNLAGQTVVQGKSLSANGQINMSGLAPGVYVFRVTLEGGQIETFKVIKK